MIEGIYRCTFDNDPYDRGEFVVKAKETEKSYILSVEKKNMYYDTYVSLLFGNKNKVTIPKGRSKHEFIHAFIGDNDFFVVYPHRMGIPLVFEGVDAE